MTSNRGPLIAKEIVQVDQSTTAACNHELYHGESSSNDCMFTLHGERMFRTHLGHKVLETIKAAYLNAGQS